MYYKKINYIPVAIFLWILIIFSACVSKGKHGSLFETLDSKRTGLDFNNTLAYNKDFNLFNYMYFYNGSGVGAGDFNNDGLIDLFFASNQKENRLYLNEGGLRFKDVTKETKIPEDGGWSTGVSVVDINNDGLLDIYICRVGQYENLNSKNQFLINQGINKDGVPSFADQAKEYGLDFSGFSTQAVFFDYDNDGDLDMFLLNHSMRESGSFRPMKEFFERSSPLSGDRLYRNDGNIFTEVTKEAGIITSPGYGLGIAIADINLDGYPDIYIGNDFQENDYIYINQQNGTFKEEGTLQMMHTSQFSMGVDVADANNDAYPEVMSVDMLPADPYMLKRSLGEDTYDISLYKLSIGYGYQYSRNNLQFNRRNGLFSELGLYSGVYATDWSWAPLWMDFDNDGLKDLFVSNGIPKRLNDIDFINFVFSENMMEERRYGNTEEVNMSLIEKFPEIKLPNKFFRNKGDMSFNDEAENVSDNPITFSNGAVYADFDNDGDLDIVVNNINDPALLYENKSSNSGIRSSLQIALKGPSNNINAIGARAVLFAKGQVRTYEKFSARGFLSSMETPIHIGLENTSIDSIFLIWPDNTYQTLSVTDSTKRINLSYKQGLPKFDYNKIRNYYVNRTREVKDITTGIGLNYSHSENKFIEFNREPLIPHMVSTEGPALAIADINHDGLEDVFIGAARGGKNGIFLQQGSGKFIRTTQPALENDSTFEDVNACWVDLNNDGHIDLVVASGGNEFYGDSPYNTPRVYLNDGKANFKKQDGAFPRFSITSSAVVPIDINGDGFLDLFIGGRAVPYSYGKVPRSYLLLNDHSGKFTDVTATYAKDLMNLGFVTNASLFDLDKDGDEDILVSLEWGGIAALINDKSSFRVQQLTDKRGWWNFVFPCDIDNDGDIDLIAGNLGLNSRLKASEKEPVRMYYNDFDDNGTLEQLLTYYLAGKEVPFANKSELERQLPQLKKKYLYAADFAKASLNELFGADKLKRAQLFTADYFSSALLLNLGNGNFETRALPWQAQLSPMRDAVMVNANNDDLPDILMVGNFYENNIAMGRYDADYGTLLINKGNGNFDYESLNGLAIKGQVRHIKPIQLGNQQAFVLARNADSTMVIQFPSSRK